MDSAAPEPASEFTGAATTDCEEAPRLSAEIESLSSFNDNNKSASLSHLSLLSCRNVAERLQGRQTNQRAEIQVRARGGAKVAQSQKEKLNV